MWRLSALHSHVYASLYSCRSNLAWLLNQSSGPDVARVRLAFTQLALIKFYFFFGISDVKSFRGQTHRLS